MGRQFIDLISRFAPDFEDCLEELVGEIVDEHDEEDTQVQRLPDGSYSVDGGMSISDLNDLLDLGLPDDHWETVAGFIFGTLEHVRSRIDALVASTLADEVIIVPQGPTVESRLRTVRELAA